VESASLRMTPSMKENSGKENSLVTVRCPGVMVGGTKVNGGMVKCTVKARKFDQTVLFATMANGARANPFGNKH
jgi:hypothetical protein